MTKSLLQALDTTPPTIEIMSLAPGSGKTQILYHLCAQVVLPQQINGKQACAVIIDTDGNFSVPQLAAQVRSLLQRHQFSDGDGPEAQIDLQMELLEALKHVHIFRPQSLATTIATIDSLASYLFDKGRHSSFDRAVGFIAIDSASAFYWQDRSEAEEAGFLTSTGNGSNRHIIASTSGYAALGASLRATCKAFGCPAIVNTWHLAPTTSETQTPLEYQRSFRAPFPAIWNSPTTLRFVLRRQPVRKFPPGIMVEQALREAPVRQKAVDDARFECFVNEYGLGESTLARVRAAGGGFRFNITESGLVMSE